MAFLYVLLASVLLIDRCLAQPPPPYAVNSMRDPSISTFSSLFGAGGFGRRGQPIMPGGGFVDDYDMGPPSMGPFLPNRMMSMGGPPPMPSPMQYGPDSVAVASVMDKDNFQPQGCGFDGLRNRCVDGLNLCKGACRDFSNDVITHDCRCVPFGYLVLLGMG
ncbi:hypothetical protein M3Y97_00018800 [Aphelenchoides bicaudatus]|nr:hypothetical protein M3Y97_00018800 [Aphelenchoides bicaudatus]